MPATTDNRLPDFFDGLLHSLPIAAGYFPVAVAFGLSASGTGLTLPETAGMSLAVFAGAAQFLTLGMLAAGAAPLQIVLSGILLNLRHVLFSASIAERTPGWSLSQHLTAAFGLTDEVFALAATWQDLSPGRLMGLELGAYSSWVAGSILGGFAGGIVPHDLQIAMGTGLYGLFAGLLAIHLRRSWRYLIPSGAAAGAHVVLQQLSPLDPGWNFTLAILAGACVGIGLPEQAASGPEKAAHQPEPAGSQPEQTGERPEPAAPGEQPEHAAFKQSREDTHAAD